MKDGKSSPIVVLPILILLVVAGIAAGIGIAIGAQDNGTTTAAAPVIPNPDLGPSCATVAGPRPATAVRTREWLQTLATCIANRITGTRYDAKGQRTGSAPVSGATDYRGIAVEGFNGDVVVVRWQGAVPPVVLARIGTLPPGTQLAYVTTAQ